MLFIFPDRSPFSMISSHLELTSLSRSNGPKHGQFGPNLLLNRSIWGILGVTLSKNPKSCRVSISQANRSPGRWFWSFSTAPKPAPRRTDRTISCHDRDTNVCRSGHFSADRDTFSSLIAPECRGRAWEPASGSKPPSSALVLPCGAPWSCQMWPRRHLLSWIRWGFAECEALDMQ